ncbi:MAG: hypothetical protein F6K09_08725 [Merismopedia sp. SIO2A8]|nr:hypothetical protein [Merismopedia sp. SIO2A8]
MQFTQVDTQLLEREMNSAALKNIHWLVAGLILAGLFVPLSNAQRTTDQHQDLPHSFAQNSSFGQNITNGSALPSTPTLASNSGWTIYGEPGGSR